MVGPLDYSFITMGPWAMVFFKATKFGLAVGHMGHSFSNHGPWALVFAKAIFLCTMTKKVSAAELNVAPLPKLPKVT